VVLRDWHPLGSWIRIVGDPMSRQAELRQLGDVGLRELILLQESP
jgi:hypothetical protein